MGALTLINYPQVPNPFAGSKILAIQNRKEPGDRSSTWALKDLQGWFVGFRQYTNNLRVITNSQWVGPIQIQLALVGQGVVLGNTYQFPIREYIDPSVTGIYDGAGVGLIPTETDTGSFIQSIDMNQNAEDAKQWDVTVHYAPYDIAHELGSSQTQSASVDPLEEAPLVDWSSIKYETSYPQDINGTPFLNTVGDPIENPPKREESRQSLISERNEAIYNDNYAQTFRDTVNGDNFLGFQPGQAKVKEITGKRIYTADYGYYWKVHYEFEFRIATFTNPDGSTVTYGFEEVVLNAGFREIKVQGATPTQVLINGSPASQPVCLTQVGKYDPRAQPYYLVFQNYLSSTFAQLNIPPDVLTANQ